VPPLPERTEFEHWLTAAGFSDVEWRDKTAAILPTAERVHRLGRFLKPLSRFLDHFGVGTLKPAHMEAFIDQYYAFRDGLGVYGIYAARRQIENTSPEFQDARPSICLMAWEMEQEVTFGFWLHAQQLQRAGL
jgi:hypothetical protein